MKNTPKKLFSLLTTCTLLLGLLPVGASAAAEDHLIINQVYGGGAFDQTGTPISRSFIELYNPTGSPISLSGWTVETDNNSDGVYTLNTTVTLPDIFLDGGRSYLIEGGDYTDTSVINYNLPSADQTDSSLFIDNKLYTITLTNGATEIDRVVADGSALKPSKQKSLCRIGYADTDTASDFAVIGWQKGSEAVNSTSVTYDDAFLQNYAPRNRAGEYGSIPGAATPPPSVIDQVTGFNNGKSSLDVALAGRYDSGKSNPDGGVIEIASYNYVNGFAYAIDGQDGVLAAIPLDSLTDGTDVANLSGSPIDIQSQVGSGFAYGDMTSVAISPDGQTLALAVQEADYTKAGEVLLFRCGSDGSLTLQQTIPTGVQPDMVTFTPDGSKALTADEGEPRDGYPDTDTGAIDPKGTVTVIDVAGGTSTVVDFAKYDEPTARDALVSSGVVLKKGAAPSLDLEPEYIACNDSSAYISLQEANAVAVLDLNLNTFTGVYPVGFEDYGSVPVDMDKGDGQYAPATHSGVKGIRMPDGISLVNIGGTDYLLTANEGDSREWGSYLNEVKKGAGAASPNGNIAAGTITGKVTYFNDSDYDGLETGVDYLFGGRSFTLFQVTDSGLHQIFDSKDQFESKTAAYLPDYFNCSNDNRTIEDRSGKKGPEPETVVTGTVDGGTYAFVTLERIGGVMVYDITDPANASFINYINSRDFSADIAGDDSPEGLKFVPADHSPTGGAVLLAACEVGGTMAVYSLTKNVVQPDTSVKIAIISDCHLYDGDTLGKTGAAFETYLSGDRKMLVESDKLMDEAVSRIKNSDAQYVLVSGDLTKDGEKQDHLLMASKLKELEAAGKQVVVINGNHDLSNADAMSYSGDTSTPVETINRADFKEIYANLGYDLAVAQDPSSLSYAVNLGDDYRLIVMDDCIYNNETDDTRYQYTAGQFQDSTLSWVLSQIRSAVLSGRRPIGMVHHGLVPHNAIQSTFFPEYLVNNYQTVAAQLADGGMNLVFTGHFHSQDAALYTSPNGSKLYDVETGSLVTYPSPIRYITLEGSNVSYTSDWVDTVAELTDSDLSAPSLSTLLDSQGFPIYSQAYLMEGLEGQIPGMLTSILVSQGIDAATAQSQAAAIAASQPFQPSSDMTLSTFLATCMGLHYAGDEGGNPVHASLAPLASAMQQSSDSSTQLLGTAAWELINDTTGTMDNPLMDTVGDNSADFTLPALPHYSSGGSGSSSASSKPTTTTATTTKNPDGSITTSTTDSASGTVTQSTAFPDGSKAVVNSQTDGKVTLSATIPSEALSTGMTLTTSAGTVMISDQAASQLKAAGSAGIEISVTPLTDGAALAEIGLGVTSGGKTVSLGGGMTLRLSLDRLVSGNSNPSGLVVSQDGKILPGAYAFNNELVLPASQSTTFTLLDNSKSFLDISSSYWASDAVTFVSSRELFKGTGGDAFSPEASMSRAMLVTILYRLAGTPTTQASTSFSDVSTGSWYADAANWSSQAGITIGTGDGFSPDQQISRQSLVTMLYRYASASGMDVSSGAGLTSFKDAGDVSPFASDAMAWAVSTGILNGGTDGNLNPTGFASRAEVSAMIQRFILSTAP